MKISIVTPVKNGERFISETIESVLNQRGDFEIEYLIMDGGSTDRTLDIAQTYKEEMESGKRTTFCRNINFQVISNPDDSMFVALASGLSKISGDIVSYLNADDFYLPNAFSCVEAIFSKFSEVHWLTGIPSRYNEQGHLINFRVPWQYDSAFIKNGMYGTVLPFIQQESVFWRSSCLEKIDLTALESYRLAGDYFLWHAFASAGFQLFVADTLLGGNRLRNGQLSENKQDYYKEFDSIKDKLNIGDSTRAVFHGLMEKLAGSPLKRRLSKNRISYRKGTWVRNR